MRTCSTTMRAALEELQMTDQIPEKMQAVIGLECALRPASRRGCA